MAENVYDGAIFIDTMTSGVDHWSDKFDDLTFLGAYSSLSVALNELQCAYEGTVGELLANGYEVCSTEYTDAGGCQWDILDQIPPRGIAVNTMSYLGVQTRHVFTTNVVDRIK